MPICLIAGSGDVNGDGKVSKADLDAIIGYIMKTSSYVTKESADVNEDGDVNAADIVELINMINQPVIITEDIGDWSEMRVFADGSLITVKNMVGREAPEEVLMILPSAELGILYSYVKFDENEVPKYITLNDNIIIVDSYYDNLVDLTVVYENTTAKMFKGLPLNPSGVSKTRSWSENNGARNATAIVEIVSGIVGVGLGAVFIAGSLVAEAGSGGASTPISIPGIIAGTATIAGGVSTFRTGWNKIFLPGSHGSDVPQTIGGQIVSVMYSNLPEYAYQNGAIPEKFADYLRDPNYANSLNKWGWTNFFVGLTAGIADNIYGRTVTWEDYRNFYNQKDENGNEKIMTGLSKDITSSSATLRGYVSPSITVSQMNGSSLENEYGIIVVSNSDSSDRHLQKSSGSGGMLEYYFKDLKPNTTYSYRTYYIDKTNSISLLGDTKTFKTENNNLPTITDFKITSKWYAENFYTNDGQTYDYCFYVSVKVTLPDRNGIHDWGYVYRDPNGREKKISLIKQSHGIGPGSYYTDTRWAYYRNGTPPFTCTFIPYVEYSGSEEIIFGEPHDFPLEFGLTSCPDANHPHWIDMGLPSGTQWRCCNEGASSPEEYGGYYTFGEVSSAPTLEQIIELTAHTVSVGTTQNGTSGRKFISQLDGGVIFLPAAGNINPKGKLVNDGWYGFYWSSTHEVESIAWTLNFDTSSDASHFHDNHNKRLSVRPVR